MDFYTVFSGSRRVAAGSFAEVTRTVSASPDPCEIFDDETGRRIEFDSRATRLPAPEKRAPGRPKLGVVAREVTLLPRHWEWLQEQPGGASTALRKLVEEARKSGQDETRRRRDAFYLFAQEKAGNLPGYEEALRAFYAKDAAKLAAETEAWPEDIRDYARRLAVQGMRA